MSPGYNVSMTQDPDAQIPTPELEELLLEAIKRGASMEKVAQLKPPTNDTPAKAIQALKQGNARFYSGKAVRPELSANERRDQIMGQTPFAAVLACSDSRVPVEVVFDQGLGQLFVIRVAGNVVGEGALGTLDYGILHLKTKLVVVLGHEGCGAVQAAMMSEADLSGEPETLQRLIARIRPSVSGLPRIRDEKARMREAVINNVRLQVARLKAHPTLKEAEAAGTIRVIGAFYEIGSGAVDFFIEDDDLAYEGEI